MERGGKVTNLPGGWGWPSRELKESEGGFEVLFGFGFGLGVMFESLDLEMGWVGFYTIFYTFKDNCIKKV